MPAHNAGEGTTPVCVQEDFKMEKTVTLYQR
jgi:hypothetical protein